MNEKEIQFENFREVFRSMLLPIQNNLEDNVLTLVREQLNNDKIEYPHQTQWLILEIQNWKTSGEPSKELLKIIKLALINGDKIYGESIANAYNIIHKEFITVFKLEHEEASNILSFSGIIALLAKSQAMSASQIAKIISSRYQTKEYPWKYIDKILSKLKIKIGLDKSSVFKLFQVDEILEEVLFADLDSIESVHKISSVAKNLGFKENLEELLLSLLNPDGEIKGTYLQMLYFQCFIAEFYDHPLTSLYEFKPRGEIGTYLNKKFPSNMNVVKENPYLNNAKSVGKLDMVWAASKDQKDMVQSMSLVSIFEGLEQMSFAARRELASWIRRWILRLIKIHNGNQLDLPKINKIEEIKKLLDSVSQKETQTYGVIEQRIVDFITSKLFNKAVWRYKGIGDSVNASNLSKKKLGDCDFQDSSGHKVIAYESHGGKLTDLYVEGHIRTLESVLEIRKQEWEQYSDVKDWKVKIVFVAHENLSSKHNEKFQLLGVDIEIEIFTFKEFIDSFELTEDLIPLFNDVVIGRLKDISTPNSVRKKYLDLIK